MKLTFFYFYLIYELSKKFDFIVSNIWELDYGLNFLGVILSSTGSFYIIGSYYGVEYDILDLVLIE